jgi:hypothetical protein
MENTELCPNSTSNVKTVARFSWYLMDNGHASTVHINVVPNTLQIPVNDGCGNQRHVNIVANFSLIDRVALRRKSSVVTNVVWKQRKTEYTDNVPHVVRNFIQPRAPQTLVRESTVHMNVGRKTEQLKGQQ